MNRAGVRCLLALLLMLGTPLAYALPDLARGIKALEAGDITAAEADLVPLAEKGYLDAQLALARHYATQDSTESQQRAAVWYRKTLKRDPSRRVPLARALMRIAGDKERREAEQLLKRADKDGDPEALRVLLRLYRDMPGLTPLAEQAPLARRAGASRERDDRGEAMNWYRLASLSDPRYVEPLLVLCADARDWHPECYVDLARQHRSGKREALRPLLDEAARAYQKQQMTIETLARLTRVLLSDDVPGEPVISEALPLLKLAAPHSVDAKARLARLLIEHPGLDAEADPVAMLKSAAENGSAEGAVFLGRIYLEGQAMPAEPASAEQWLTRAATTEPAAHFYLGRLHERGYDGRADPQRALQHYLQAARGGYARADLAIAQMLSKNRGVRIDLVTAYAFARLAERNGVVGSVELLAQLRTQMDNPQFKRGAELAQQELDARTAAASQIASNPREEKS